MGNKRYYLIVDTETTVNRHVFDFSAIICDKQGKIYQQIAVCVNNFKHEEFFHDRGNSGFFAQKNLNDRHKKYEKMLHNGDRMLASVTAVNNWLCKANELYGKNLYLTAYNICFDAGVCKNSGINLSIIKNSFCLWGLACRLYCKRSGYIKFCIKNKYFTEKLNMKSNAEIMAHYITGKFSNEPHTALEDIIYYELPILVDALRQKKGLGVDTYSWKKYQLPIVIEGLGVAL